MTRLASIMGVATVATLVLLSGCETAVTTDYAKDLVGSWESVDLNRTIPLNSLEPMNLTAVTTSVTATIMAGDEKNAGTFMLAVTDTVVAAMQQTPSISVNGTFTVDSSTITLTVTGPPETAALLGDLPPGPQDLAWELMGNELKVSSPLLPVLLANATIMGVPFTEDTKLTFTKQSGTVAGSR